MGAWKASVHDRRAATEHSCAQWIPDDCYRASLVMHTDAASLSDFLTLLQRMCLCVYAQLWMDRVRAMNNKTSLPFNASISSYIGCVQQVYPRMTRQLPIACISGFPVVAYLPRLAQLCLAQLPIACISGFPSYMLQKKDRIKNFVWGPRAGIIFFISNQTKKLPKFAQTCLDSNNKEQTTKKTCLYLPRL